MTFYGVNLHTSAATQNPQDNKATTKPNTTAMLDDETKGEQMHATSAEATAKAVIRQTVLGMFATNGSQMQLGGTRRACNRYPASVDSATPSSISSMPMDRSARPL